MKKHTQIGILSGLFLTMFQAVTGPQGHANDVILRVGTTRGGETVPAVLRLPTRTLTANERLPLLLIFGGFESAASVLDLVGAQSSVALASFDYPFQAPRRFEFPQSLGAIPQLKALFPKTRQGITDLLAQLKTRPEIDSQKILIVGASFGTPFALAAAVDHPELAGIALVHGFGRAPQTLYQVICRSWVPKYGEFARLLAWPLAHLGWLYLGVPAPESLANALHPDQAVLLVTADRDSFISRESSNSLWSAIEKSPAKTSRLVMATDHLMPGSEPLIAEIVKKIVAWMKETGLSAR